MAECPENAVYEINKLKREIEELNIKATSAEQRAQVK